MNSSACSSSPLNHERRRVDRRSNSLRSVLYGVVCARRRQARRGESATGYYVDWYSPPLLLSALGVVVCCFADALFTLQLLQLGARELNPVMDALIRTDAGLFIRVKYLLTCFCVLVLVLHKNFFLLNRLRVEYVMHACFALYAVLIGYELMLLFAS